MSGRRIIVTGGTGALGSEIVGVFLDAGDTVVVPWIVGAEAEALSERFAEAAAAERLRLLEADVSDEAGAALAAKAAGSDLAVLVNGVGGFAGGDAVADTPLDVWDRLWRMNVRTAVAMSRAAAPLLSARGGGAIVNVASQAAFDGPAGIAAYAASKAGVVALTRSLQNELAADGVRVNAVVPTTIDTPANRAAMPDADFAAWTPPARIAGVILWLASDAAASVRGGMLPV
ncbi:MAG: SDR family NAD(P)-dependent oxidoreductase [Proteobacteria bacterium]|nr:SDR family NAD(P)-dependent oxidoreductase [Pseudomonadota bacterium]